MPKPRYRLVDTRTTPYYHCIARCVRRAFLCGFDTSSGKNFDHRKQWILDRIKLLSSVFAVDVCAYAIMSNHFHLVLHVDTEKSQRWSEEEVIDRWLKLYKGPLVAQKHRNGECLTEFEHESLNTGIETWRGRLADLSWYMRCLNETIARMANAEDDCSGRFWEGRFRSQALLDEAALISCMAYVDLNPVRAKTSRTLEQSDFTSIQERLGELSSAKEKKQTKPGWLLPLVQKREATAKVLPLTLKDYVALVDWTGRAVRADKRGVIPSEVKPILERMGAKEENWVDNTQYFGKRFPRLLGRVDKIRQFASRIDQRWINGLSQAKAFYR